jgi:hypothetical protein
LIEEFNEKCEIFIFKKIDLGVDKNVKIKLKWINQHYISTPEKDVKTNSIRKRLN